MWSRKYRPTYQEDHQTEERVKDQVESTFKILEELIMDDDFVAELRRRGVDILKKTTSEAARDGGLDTSYFI
jgi:hypothetical protein